MRRATTIALLVALLAACGGKPGSRATNDPTATGTPASTISGTETPAASGTPAASPATRSPGSTEEPHPEDSHLGDTYDPDRLPPSGFRKADSGEQATGSERIQVVASTEPVCAEQGGSVTFTAKSKPDVQIGFLTTVPHYPDGKAQEKRGRTGPDGLFSWTVPVPREAAAAQYTLFVAVADDKGTDGGRSGKWFHVIARPGECP